MSWHSLTKKCHCCVLVDSIGTAVCISTWQLWVAETSSYMKISIRPIPPVRIHPEEAAYQSNGAALLCLRGHMAYDKAMWPSWESAICNEGHILPQPCPNDRTGGGQHLGHAWTPLGPLIPDHNHTALHQPKKGSQRQWVLKPIQLHYAVHKTTVHSNTSVLRHAS